MQETMLKKFLSSKSTGSKDLSPRVLREVSHDIVFPLSNLSNITFFKRGSTPNTKIASKELRDHCKKFITKHQKPILALYNSPKRPHLQYMAELWSAYQQEDRNRLKRI